MRKNRKLIFLWFFMKKYFFDIEKISDFRRKFRKFENENFDFWKNIEFSKNQKFGSFRFWDECCEQHINSSFRIVGSKPSIWFMRSGQTDRYGSAKILNCFFAKKSVFFQNWKIQFSKIGKQIEIRFFENTGYSARVQRLGVRRISGNFEEVSR